MSGEGEPERSYAVEERHGARCQPWSRAEGWRVGAKRALTRALVALLGASLSGCTTTSWTAVEPRSLPAINDVQRPVAAPPELGEEPEYDYPNANLPTLEGEQVTVGGPVPVRVTLRGGTQYQFDPPVSASVSEEYLQLDGASGRSGRFAWRLVERVEVETTRAEPVWGAALVIGAVVVGVFSVWAWAGPHGEDGGG